MDFPTLLTTFIVLVTIVGVVLGIYTTARIYGQDGFR